MNKKSFIIIGLVLLFSGITNAATTVTKLGQNPFHTPSLMSVDDLFSMVRNNETDVKRGFDRAGYTNLIDPFLTQLPEAEVELVDFPKGSEFEWMFFKNKATGDISVIKDVTWGNEKPFSGYQFYVDDDGNRYDFAVPLVCGNIALIGVSPTPEAVLVPIVPVVPVADATESVVEKDANISPIIAAAPLAAAGALKLLADLGYLHQFDPAYHGLARIGAEYNFSEKFALLGLIGIAPHIGGDDGATAFVADLLGEFKFGKSFLDLGVGGWLTKGEDDNPAENTQLDIIAALGTRLFGDPDGFNTSLFLETRQGVDELGSHEIKSFGRYGGGLRFRF